MSAGRGTVTRTRRVGRARSTSGGIIDRSAATGAARIEG